MGRNSFLSVAFHYGVFSLQLKQSKLYLRDGEERFKEALTILDYRFFLIPIMFALLRMWTCMLFIFKIYFQLNGIPPPISVVVGYLSVSCYFLLPERMAIAVSLIHILLLQNDYH